jgi:hypothetical protein
MFRPETHERGRAMRQAPLHTPAEAVVLARAQAHTQAPVLAPVLAVTVGGYASWAGS